MRVHRWPLLFASLLWLCPAAAQTNQNPAEVAQRLFDDGLRYMLDGDLKMGCALIKESLDIDPTPGTIFTLAECYARAGKIASAVEYYDEYLDVYSRFAPHEQEEQRARADVSKTERSRLVKQVPWVTVVLPEDAPEGVVVTMDDEAFPSSFFGVAIALDPGKHWFTARIPGGPLARSEIVVEPGTRRTHYLELHQTPEEGDGGYMEPGEDTGTSAEGRSPWVYALGGLGIAGVATGAVTGILLLQERSKILDQCENDLGGGRVSCGDPDDPEAREAVEAAERAQDTLAPITTVALAVGVGSLAAATIWWFADAPKPATADEEVAARADVGPGYAGVSVSGRF